MPDAIGNNSHKKELLPTMCTPDKLTYLVNVMISVLNLDKAQHELEDIDFDPLT